MKHEHDPVLMLDGLIKCKTCGTTLPSMEEEISIVTSRRRAEKILQEIAVAGSYQADRFEEGFVVYSKEDNNYREEVTAQKTEGTGYRVLKRVISNTSDD